MLGGSTRPSRPTSHDSCSTRFGTSARRLAGASATATPSTTAAAARTCTAPHTNIATVSRCTDRNELRLCLRASEEALFYDGVNTPVSVHDLCHPKIDGD